MRTVLVTGGSSGLGLALSRRFAGAGDRLLWVSHDAEELARSEEQLRAEVPGVEVHSLAQDLVADGADDAVHGWARSLGNVDVLVNCAGLGNYGFLQEIPIERELLAIRLNAVALFQLTRRFLDDMRSRDSGTIVQISSNSSFQPVPKMAVYAATKAFVTSLSRGLEEELRMQGSKVRVMTVCPAAIRDTPFRKVNGMDQVKTFDGLATTTTAEVCNDIWRGLQTGQRFVVSGWRQRALMWLRPWLPHRVLMALVRREVTTAPR